MSPWNTRTAVTALALVFALAGCGGGEEAPEAAPEEAAPTPAPAPAPAADGAMVDPDAATAEQLRTVPHIDEATAAELVAARPFADMLAVDAILAPKLSEQQRDEVYAVLWKPLDLNSASEAEILLIPNIGANMPHEFEEYRPYTDIDQFRREIGKYVDAAEVARLERYVTIR